MSTISFPRMTVLQSLDQLTASITPNRFISSRPNAVGEQMKEFLLISLNDIKDSADTYQLSRGRISIFVRDISTSNGNVENTLRLEQLQNEVLNLFPIVTDTYHGKRPLLVAGGTDGAGFHYLIIQFNITILK